MTAHEVETLLTIGENIAIEFKRCGDGPKGDVYQSICAFLNRHGGDILLGVNVDRYDDRETVGGNLIEAFDKIEAFGVKHLDNKFFIESGYSVNIRSKILREMIGNTLAHREYTSGLTARFIIERERMFMENANKSVNQGIITPQNLRPFPKNPIIANFFHQIGRADELGSGVRNLYHYVRLYSGADPVFEEGDIFRLTVPLNVDFSPEKGEDVQSLTEDTPKAPRKHPKSTQKTPQKHPENTQKNETGISRKKTASRIIDLIRFNPKITVPKLAHDLSLSVDGVKTALKRLKSKHIIVRVGPNRGGHWEVVG